MQIARTAEYDKFGLEHDETGKVVFDDIYCRADPSEYYLTLQRYNYIIPTVAKPVFSALYDAYRLARPTGRLKIVDVGCSYGVNAVLQRWGLTLAELTGRYAGLSANRVPSEEIIEQDRLWLTSRPEQLAADFIGADIAHPAVDYACAVGALAAGLAANLETEELDPAGREAVEGADFLISTGAIGYVGENTYRRLLDGAGGRPWLVSFVLRMFDYGPIADVCAERGYVTEYLDGLIFAQRRFADAHERDECFARLKALGREPGPLEHSGWFSANVYVSRPEEDAEISAMDLLPVHAATRI